MATFNQNPDVDSGAAEQLVAAPTPVKFGTALKAPAANTGTVYVGLDNTVSATSGWPLAPGDEAFVSKEEADDASKIWVRGSADNQVVAYRAV